MSKEILKYKPRDTTFRGKRISREEKEKQFYQAIKENGLYDKIIIKSDFVNFSTKVLCQCKIHTDYEWWALPKNLKNGKGCRKCATERNAQKKKLTQEEFLKRFRETGCTEEIEIIGEYTGLKNNIECWCKKGHHKFFMRGYNLLKGCHCFDCSYENRNKPKMERAYNKLLKYIEDNNLDLVLEGEYKGVHQKTSFRCKNCGNEWITAPSKITSGRKCPFCNDGFSFPNKVIRVLLSFLKPKYYDFEYQIKGYDYQYDGYFIDNNNQKILIEMDGEQHRKTSTTSNWKPLAEQQKIDKEKDKLAENNGYKLIRVICPENHKEVIKNLRESELKNYLNFSNVDWEEIMKQAEKSLIIELSSFFVQHPNSTKKILRETFHISDSTVGEYIKIGKDIGIIPIEQNIKRFNGKYNPETKEVLGSKPFLVYSVDNLNIPIHIFCSKNDCANFYKNKGIYLKTEKIAEVLEQKIENYKDLFFKFATTQDLINNEDIIREVEKKKYPPKKKKKKGGKL